MDSELCLRKKQVWSENTITTNVLKHPPQNDNLLMKVSMDRSGLHTTFILKDVVWCQRTVTTEVLMQPETQHGLTTP